MPANLSIAYFISPHGFGHAARAAGVMEALHALAPSLRFEIFTQVPRWFFDDSLAGEFGYHYLLTDIGLAQKTPLKADLAETVLQLDHFLPFDNTRLMEPIGILNQLKCRLIVCDISPLGIAVAKEMGVPSLLIENFTWDWIYEGYARYDGRLVEHVDYLRGLFGESDFHIQTEPVCRRRPADLTTRPVSRKIKTQVSEIRNKLRIPQSSRAVLITMGGIKEPYPFLKKLGRHRDIHFVIPGGSNRVEMKRNVVLLPHHSDYFHPDLVNASDAVIGKVGYSTLAEIYWAGVPFGYVARSRFRESRKLVSFIKKSMQGLSLGENEFYAGDWLSNLPDLLGFPRIRRRGPLGAEQAARFISDLIS